MIINVLILGLVILFASCMWTARRYWILLERMDQASLGDRQSQLFEYPADKDEAA